MRTREHKVLSGCTSIGETQPGFISASLGSGCHDLIHNPDIGLTLQPPEPTWCVVNSQPCPTPSEETCSGGSRDDARSTKTTHPGACTSRAVGNAVAAANGGIPHASGLTQSGEDRASCATPASSAGHLG